MSENQERKIWYQLLEGNELGTKQETTLAYEAFEIYLQMGSNRNMRDVGQKLDKSHATISRWASDYKWCDRAEAYDQFKHDVAIKSHEASLLSEAEIHQADWIKKRTSVRNEEYEIGLIQIRIGKKLLQKIDDNPEAEVRIRRTKKQNEDDGTKVFANAYEMTDNAVKLVEAGFKLCRNSIDLPIGSFGVQNFASVPTSVEDLMNLDEDKRKQYLSDLDNAEASIITEIRARGESLDDLPVLSSGN